MGPFTKNHLECHLREGSTRARLGRAKVPAGYAILLNADESHFYWLAPDGTEGCIDCSKWQALRGAKAHAKKATLGVRLPFPEPHVEAS